MPNQPITFKNDPTNQSRTEDDLIGWTWKAFLDNTSDPNILLQLPMTKATIRGIIIIPRYYNNLCFFILNFTKAMDAATEFTQKLGVANIKKFMVSGASKRGWISWLTVST